MRVGISPFASTREGALAIATTAVDGGIDTLWLGEGYLANPDFSGFAGGMESLTTLAWLAGALPTARVGITAAVLPIRDLGWLAKQANTIGWLAGGGMVLVVAPGYWPQDLEARGMAYAGRGAEFARRLDTVRAVLADPSLSPGPPPTGAVPVWLAGAEATLRRAAALRLPFQSSRRQPEDLVALAREYFDAGGPMLCHRVRVEVGTHAVVGREVDWHAVTGSPDQVADALGRYRELGVADLSIIPGQDDATSLVTVEALVADVLPQL